MDACVKETVSRIELAPSLVAFPRSVRDVPPIFIFFEVSDRQWARGHFLRKTVASACTRYARGHFPQNAQGYSFMKAGVRVADNTLTRGLHYMESESEMVLGMVLTLRWNGVDCCLPRTGLLVAKVKTILFTFGVWYKYIARDLYTGPTPLGRGSGPRGRRQPTGDTRRAAAPPTVLLLVWVLVGGGQRRGGANRPGGRSMRAHAEIELKARFGILQVTSPRTSPGKPSCKAYCTSGFGLRKCNPLKHRRLQRHHSNQ